MFIDTRLLGTEMLLMECYRSYDSSYFPIFETPGCERRFIREVRCPNGVFIPNGRRLEECSR